MVTGDERERSWENDGIFHLMRRVMQSHHALWRERLPALTPVQFAVLLSVRNLPGADQKTIGDASAVEPTTMANLVSRLERRGLLARECDTSDARRRCLQLTDTGRAELDAAMPIVRTIRDDMLTDVPAPDAWELRRILATLAQTEPADHQQAPGSRTSDGP